MKRYLIAGLLSTWLGVTGSLHAQITTPSTSPIPTRLPGAARDTTPAPGTIVVAPPGAPTAIWVDSLGCPTCGEECQRGVLAHINDGVKHPLNCDPLRIYGYLDGGYVYNANNPASKFNGPYNAQDRAELLGNQAYLVIEKALKGGEGIDVGFRVDLLYGFDFFLAQSKGLELTDQGVQRWNGSQYYGLALPQLYGEVGNENYSLKVGHFYSVVGYESVMSTQNFFYSHSYSYMFAGPFTHWGVMGSAKMGNFSADAAIVNGWNALDRNSDQPNFMGRVKWTSDENTVAVSFAVITGNESTLVNTLDRNRTRYSFIVDVNPSCDFEYVFHQWGGLQDDGFRRREVAQWYGIDQYAYYKISDCLRAGARLEWFRDEDGTRVGLNRPNNPNKRPFRGNFYEATLGLNYSPIPNVRIRPEVRYDFQGSGQAAFDDGDKKSQFLAGIDVLIQF